MKKITSIIVGIVISFASYAQQIQDQAVIPLSVTLNSIMRLQVTAGGNIEFSFNSINSYASGFGNTAQYTTSFSVASSVDFNVVMTAENGGDLIGEATNATLDGDVIGFGVNLTGATDCSSTYDASTEDPELLNVIGAAASPANYIVEPTTGLNNGGKRHTFGIEWECGTDNPDITGALKVVPLDEKNAAPDRYSTNVFLTLEQD